MPYKIEANKSDVELYKAKLKMPYEEVLRILDKGGKLEWENSSFSDPGPDWCRLLLNGEEIVYVPGY